MAVILITNSHFAGVMPTDMLSHGGMLGNIIFFAMSGYCLFQIKDNFIMWYGKRLLRIYPYVWVVACIYMFLGLFNMQDRTVLYYLIYPLYYAWHFVISIIILYIPYYVVRWMMKKWNIEISLIIKLTYLIHFLIYFIFYKKDYYHIDDVLEPMIRFLFFEAMLWGIYFKLYEEKYIDNKAGRLCWFKLFISLILYLGTKLLCLRVESFAPFQIINQITIMVILLLLIRCIQSVENTLMKLPERVYRIVKWFSRHTLEIYLVQHVIIDFFRNYVFPFNLLLIIVTVLLFAEIVGLIVDNINKFIKKRIER